MEDTIRPSKAIMTHGAGSIVDLSKGRSELVMSPDYWHSYDIIKEYRLANLLNVKYFRSPKQEYVRTSDGKIISGITVRRFPYLWYCPYCRRLQPSDTCKWCSSLENKVPTVPPRLIAACEGGHIQDFPWKAWVGCDNPNHVIELHPSSGVSDLDVVCPECEKDGDGKGKRSLKGALGPLNFRCLGKRPWIGDDKANQSCGRKLHGLMRGGSNVYFPIIMSSLVIPRLSWKIYAKIITQNDLDFIKQAYDMYKDKTDTMFSNLLERTIDKYRPHYIDIKGSDYDTEDFQSAFLYYCKETPSTNIKFDEWNALKDPVPPPKKGDEVEFHPEQLNISNSDFLNNYFDKIVLVKRLTEVIALTGFTRIRPPKKGLKSSNDDSEELAISSLREDDGVKWTHIKDEMINGNSRNFKGYKHIERVDFNSGAALKNSDRDWLPGTKNRGEGIFFVFNKNRILDWEKNPFWIDWVKKIKNNGIDTLNIMTGFDFLPRGLLLHSFSHAMSKQIAKACGYQLASLRERLYCSEKDDMRGILIYTSTADSQGSLGGLISQAKDLSLLEEHVRSVIDSSKFCSQDPLCGIHNPETTGKPWGAACHSCLHIPETSCELLMNRFLDRHTLAGNGKQKEGYFV